jgi:DtxR family Mn-dependent transcriptional regulator
VEIRSIAEHVQLDTGLMTELKEIGLVPGETIEVSPIGDRAGTVEVRGIGDAARIQTAVAHAVLAHAR